MKKVQTPNIASTLASNDKINSRTKKNVFGYP